MSEEVKYLDKDGVERFLRRLGGEWLKDYGENNYKHVVWRTYLDGAVVDEVLEEDQLDSISGWKYQSEDIDTVVALDGAVSGNSAAYTFYCCTKLSKAFLSDLDTSSLTDASCMFDCCTSLEGITGELDFSGITSYTTYFTDYAFRNCTSLTSVYIKGLRTSLNLSYCPLTVECAAYLLENLGDIYNSSYATITFDADMQDEYEADGDFETYSLIAETNGWTITYA